MRRLRIGVTQRWDAVPGRNEVREALDSNWSSILWELGFVPLPLTAGIGDYNEYLTVIAPDGFILSGGPDIGEWPIRDAFELAVLNYSKANSLPVLGFCRGLQLINHFQGGSLQPTTKHTALLHEIKGPLTQNMKRSVNSFHNLGVFETNLGDELYPVAWSNDGVIEALRHSQLPWLGIMWHPERSAHIPKTDRNLIIKHFKGTS